MLVEEPALGDTVGTGAEGGASHSRLDLAPVFEFMAEPAGVDEVVAVVPAVLQLPDELLGVEG